jgi:hypothetical protein
MAARMNASTSLCGTRLVHGLGDRAKNAELLRIFADELGAEVQILGRCFRLPVVIRFVMGCARVMATFRCRMARRGNALLVRQRPFNLERHGRPQPFSRFLSNPHAHPTSPQSPGKTTFATLYLEGHPLGEEDCMARTIVQITADPSYLYALCDDGEIFRLVNHAWQPMAPIPQGDFRAAGMLESANVSRTNSRAAENCLAASGTLGSLTA